MADADSNNWIESAHKDIMSIEKKHTSKEDDVSDAKTKKLHGTLIIVASGIWMGSLSSTKADTASMAIYR